MSNDRDDTKKAHVLDFTPSFRADTPMGAIRHAESEIRSGRFDNITIVLHKREPEGGSCFLLLDNDMDYDARASMSLWLLNKVMGRTNDE